MSYLVEIRRFVLALAIGALALFGLAPNTHASATAGDLIKCPDFQSVYYLADDGSRNVFPDEGTYFSWYEDFEDVKEVSCDDLSDLPIGELVEYQAGTQLVTTPSISQVYAVEPGGILRQIQDEEMAKTLYGEQWSQRVRDVPDTFFTHYDVAEPLNEGELPEGMFIEDDDGNLYRIADGVAVEIDDVISETKEALFAQHAVEMSQMQAALDELGVVFSIQAFAEEMMGLFATKMVSWMETVDAGDQLDEFYLSLDEMDKGFGYELEEELAAAYDDADGDGLKDFWEAFITPYDGEGEDHWDDAFKEWDEKEYDVYYNEYWEDFEGEHNYDEWVDDYDEFWVEYQWDDEGYDDYYEHYEEFPQTYEHYDEWIDWDEKYEGEAEHEGWINYYDEYTSDEGQVYEVYEHEQADAPTYEVYEYDQEGTSEGSDPYQTYETVEGQDVYTQDEPASVEEYPQAHQYDDVSGTALDTHTDTGTTAETHEALGA